MLPYVKKILTLIILLSPGCVYGLPTQIKHVILIGVDGFGAYCFPTANMPNIKKMMAQGSYTLHARCVLPSSSAVNWASMTMGSTPELHGYTERRSKAPELPPKAIDSFNRFPSIFSILREQRPDAEIGAFYTWGGIYHLIPVQALSHNEHSDSDINTINEAINYLKEKKPDLLFIQLDEVDQVGHRNGHNTPKYYKQVTKTDENLGKLWDAVNETGMGENTIIILTADHGGLGHGHGGVTMQEMEIPWVILGPNVKKNHEITESIMTYDTAATIAYILHLNIPQVWVGRPVKSVMDMEDKKHEKQLSN
ncbi:alkaline phosphatase [Solitalea koreensis]|nr:alkaline phosphatase [Solitalea koreensis]